MSNIRKISIVQVFLFIVSVLPVAFCECQNGELLDPNLNDPDISPNEPNFSDELKDEIVQVHNYYRSCIATQNALPYCWQYGAKNKQPGAHNMLEMQWDERLAQMAQRWVNRCIFEHESPESISYGHPDFKEIGSSLRRSFERKVRDDENEDPPVIKYLKEWFNEHKDYNYHKTRPAECSSRNTCHYTQMIWHSTNKVGCGYSYFYTKSKGIYTRFIACYYGPIGNYPGDYPYENGAGTCSNGFSQGSYKGLCTNRQREPEWNAIKFVK